MPTSMFVTPAFRKSQFLELQDGTLTAEASELGIRPGHEPQVLALDDGQQEIIYSHRETIAGEDGDPQYWIFSLVGPGPWIMIFND